MFVAAIHADVVALGESEGIRIGDPIREEEDTLGDDVPNRAIRTWRMFCVGCAMGSNRQTMQ